MIKGLFSVGGIREDQVVACRAMVQETQGIIVLDVEAVHPQLHGGPDDEGAQFTVPFECRHLGVPLGTEFEGDAPAAGKEVKDFQLVEIETVLKDVEQPFFGPVGRGSLLHAFRGLDDPFLMFAANDPQDPRSFPAGKSANALLRPHKERDPPRNVPRVPFPLLAAWYHLCGRSRVPLRLRSFARYEG